MIISDKTIRELNSRGLLVEQPLTDIQLQPNSVDLTLGTTWKRLKINSFYEEHDNQMDKPIIDPSKPMEYTEGTIPEDGILIKPGDFILMASNEILNIPNGIVGLVCGRSSIARMGIQTEQAGFIDSGFRGTITFEVTNQLKYPVLLRPGMRVAQVYFLRSEYSDRLYGKDKGSKYVGQIDAMQSQIHLDAEFDKNAISRILTS